MKKIIVLLLAVIVAFALFFKLKEKRKVLVPVKVAVVKRGEVRNVIEATGIIKPQVGAKVKVGARISGTVVEENVKVGDRIKKGDLIAVIDNRELKAELERAKANLKEIEETYPKRIKSQKLKVKSAQAELKAAVSRLNSERENLKLKEWEFDRQKKLLSIGYTTEEKFKKAKRELAAAESSYREALENLKKAKLNLKIQKEELKRLEVEFKQKLKEAKEQLKQAEVRYSYSFIYAPISGVISYVSTQKGETVVAGLNAPQFVTILDPRKLENRIYVDETEIGKVKKGMPVEFSVDAYRNKVFKAKVVEIYPEPIIRNNVVYYIVVARGFENPNLLKPEMTTHNRIISGVKKNVLVLPNEAVKWKNGRYVVYKVTDRGVVEVPVEVGWSDDRFTEILSGLKEGDRVAVSLSKK